MKGSRIGRKGSFCPASASRLMLYLSCGLCFCWPAVSSLSFFGNCHEGGGCSLGFHHDSASEHLGTGQKLRRSP